MRKVIRTPFRIFVTGTDTGVGKTETAAALLSLLADSGHRPAPFKPYESGCASVAAPADALTLKTAAQSDDDLAAICPHRFRAPLAPGVAAARLGCRSDLRKTLRAFHTFDDRALVVEGAGGLFVPLDPAHDVIDLIALLNLPVLLVARARLGTLNHVALSLHSLAARKIPVAAVVLSRSEATRDRSERGNAELIRRRHRVQVLGPVPYEVDPGRRRIAFRRALQLLVKTSGR